MKISRRKKWIILSLLALFILSAASFLQRADDSNPSVGMQIYRLEDGTTLVVNSQNNFEFTVPSGWYPFLVPTSPDEMEKFSVVNQQYYLPFDTNWISTHTFDGLLLTAVDLNSNYYNSDPNIPMLLAYTDITPYSPSGLISPIISILKSSGRVTDTYVTEYAEQEVGIVEFQSLEDETPFLGGKMLVFIRNGYLFFIVAQADNQEVLPKIKQTIDDISGSLRFYDIKQ